MVVTYFWIFLVLVSLQIVIVTLYFVEQNVPAKKQVRFNMERNKEYFYSYAQGSDDDFSGDLMSNVNFVDYKSNDNNTYENDDDEDDDDDEDSEEDEEDEEDYSDHTDWDSSEDDSRVDKFGYLVDKSTPPAEVNNNSSDLNIGVNSKTLNGTTDSVDGISDSVGEKLIVNGPIDHKDVQNGKLDEENRLLDLRTQVRMVCCILQKKLQHLHVRYMHEMLFHWSLP